MALNPDTTLINMFFLEKGFANNIYIMEDKCYNPKPFTVQTFILVIFGPSLHAKFVFPVSLLNLNIWMCSDPSSPIFTFRNLNNHAIITCSFRLQDVYIQYSNILFLNVWIVIQFI